MSMGRKRSESCRLNILDAAVELMEENGYLGLTVEDVAARAKAGKQTIYRHWGGKQRLALEAFAHKASTKMSIPDTGALQGDLQDLLHQMATGLGAPGKKAMLGGLLAEVQCAPELGQTFRETLVAVQRKGLRTVFQRAIARGELSPERDLDILCDLVYGPVWYRFLVSGAPLDEAFVSGLTDSVLRVAGLTEAPAV